MPDHPTAPSAPGAALPTQQANHFSLAMNGSEFLLAFGVSRLTMSQKASTTAAQHQVEWVAALSISPMAAMQLTRVLEANVKAYEEKFGKIPVDRNFRINQSD
jgi:hypothetical protein